MEPRVFAIERDTRFDLTSCNEYGRITFLSENGDWNPLNMDLYAESVSLELRKLHFDPKRDYILLMGRMLKAALFLAQLAIEHDDLQVLVFNSQERKYVPTSFSPLHLSEVALR